VRRQKCPPEVPTRLPGWHTGSAGSAGSAPPTPSRCRRCPRGDPPSEIELREGMSCRWGDLVASMCSQGSFFFRRSFHIQVGLVLFCGQGQAGRGMLRGQAGCWKP
jgi:hypothetical protein